MITLTPNTLIIGAPKSGSTSLTDALQSSEHIFLPPEKETYFWSESYRTVRSGPSKQSYAKFETGDFNSYQKRYFRAKKPVRVVCDASTDTLYHSATSVSKISKSLGSSVKIIVLVRDPLSGIRSRYKHNVSRGWEKLDLNGAIEEWPIRKEQGWSFDFDYVGQFLYSKHIRKFAQSFHDLLVINSEYLFQNPADSLKELLDWLGIEHSENISMPHNDPASLGWSLFGFPGGNKVKQLLYHVLPNESFSNMKNTYRRLLAVMPSLGEQQLTMISNTDLHERFYISLLADYEETQNLVRQNNSIRTIGFN